MSTNENIRLLLLVIVTDTIFITKLLYDVLIMCSYNFMFNLYMYIAYIGWSYTSLLNAFTSSSIKHYAFTLCFHLQVLHITHTKNIYINNIVYDLFYIQKRIKRFIFNQYKNEQIKLISSDIRSTEISIGIK